MKNWRNKLFALSAALLLIGSLTACETFDEWEARTGSEVREDYRIDTGNTEKGPNLADYVNAGIEEAKENGRYTETDYSDILIDSAATAPGQSPDSAGQNRIESDIPMSEKMSEEEWNEILGLLAVLEYEGEPYSYVNDNIPYFTMEELTSTDAFELYSELDELGRTGVAFASINKSIMPAEGETRGDISSIKPTGWVQAQYAGIGNGDWLYNRCHLIAWSLAGENANACNLMTGTRYFNVEGMLPFEMQALSYLGRNPENHVLYRATPVYNEDDLLAKGLLMEAYSIEDEGELSFCVFIYNVQPGVEIDYATGKSQMAE